MRYQCLVLDHDDTVVNSTATINYPAFVQTLQKLRPDVHMTLCLLYTSPSPRD